MLPPFRHFLVLIIFAPAVAAVGPQRIQPERATRDGHDPILWYDVRLLPIEGKAWTDTKAPYDRLPARAEGKVRDAVWNLSRDSAGMAVRFITDAETIHARWTLTSKGLAMPHMPATGVSGLDLYVQHEGRWHFLACGQPTQQTNQVKLVSGLDKGDRTYLLYLPLYNGVSSVEIGVGEDRYLSAPAARPEAKQKPIVFYGTSITQGGCASRPGMVHTAILGRWFDRPVINLGFSGNGRMETEVVTFIAEIDAAVYVLDCLPNLKPEQVAERTEPCVEILRAAHPDTPILLVEDRSYANAFLVSGSRQHNTENRAALHNAFERLKSAGDRHLYYLEGEHLLGDDGEGTVDTSHPTDLGFMRQASAFARALEPILGAPNLTTR